MDWLNGATYGRKGMVRELAGKKGVDKDSVGRYMDRSNSFAN